MMLNYIADIYRYLMFASVLSLITLLPSANAFDGDPPTIDDLIQEALCQINPDPFRCGGFECPPYCLYERDPRIMILQNSLQFDSRNGRVELFQAGKQMELSNEHGEQLSINASVKATRNGYTLRFAIDSDLQPAVTKRQNTDTGRFAIHSDLKGNIAEAQYADARFANRKHQRDGLLSFRFRIDDVEHNIKTLKVMTRSLEPYVYPLVLGNVPDETNGPKFDQCAREYLEDYYWLPQIFGAVGCLIAHSHVVDDE